MRGSIPSHRSRIRRKPVRKHSFRPAFQQLEYREAPGNLLALEPAPAALLEQELEWAGDDLSAIPVAGFSQP